MTTTTTTESYTHSHTRSLHYALPISQRRLRAGPAQRDVAGQLAGRLDDVGRQQFHPGEFAGVQRDFAFQRCVRVPTGGDAAVDAAFAVESGVDGGFNPLRGEARDQPAVAITNQLASRARPGSAECHRGGEK